MKKFFLFQLVVLVLLIVSCSKDEFPTKFSTLPEKPKVGEEISIKYKSDIEKLAKAEKLDMIVYSYGTDLLNTNKITLEKKGEGWIGKFTPTENTMGLIIKFQNDESFDNNKELGYVVKLFGDNGNEIIGANAGLANVYTKWAGTIELNSDKELANKYFMDEFKIHPEIKREFLLSFVNTFPKNKKDSVAAVEIEKLEENDNLSQSDFEFLANSTRQIGDHVKALKYIELLETKFPKSKFVENRYYTKFRNMLTTEKKEMVFDAFMKVNPESNLAIYMLTKIINEKIENGNLESAKKMLDTNSMIANSNLYNSISWKMFESKKNLKEASSFGEKGIHIARNELSNPKNVKPVYMDNEEWEMSKKTSLGMILDTYGNIQNALGNKDQELKAFEEAVAVTNSESVEMNESYITSLFNLGEYKTVKEKAEEFIAKGYGSDKIKNILVESAAKLGVDKKELDSYLGKMEAQANKKMIEKLKLTMINRPAPTFTLTDITGRSVNFSDFKGKTVVVDFWATWCGPCLQSFPIMKKAVEKYSSDENVKFLFINTRERVDDKMKNAVDFIAKNKYPFHVLVDEKNEVIDSYGVEGIPTKFIVDKNGNIRFKSVGLEGSESEVLSEIDHMISMVK